jgi:hypothetical protein
MTDEKGPDEIRVFVERFSFKCKHRLMNVAPGQQLIRQWQSIQPRCGEQRGNHEA